MGSQVFRFSAAFFLLFCVLAVPCCGEEVKRLKERELQKLTKEETLVLALAYAGSCDNCAKHRALLMDIKEQVGGDIDGLVVVESRMASVDEWIAGDDEHVPVLLYYRNGSPVPYDGELDVYMMSMWLSTHRKSFVLELNDSTFEHDTQAATGATTGHWMVMFSEDDCVSCQNMHSVWDTAAARLHGKVLFANVNLRSSPDLRERFSISSTPTIMYFRQGHQYVMPLTDENVRASHLIDFATSEYESFSGEAVTPPRQKPVELYKHLAMLCAVLLPFGFLAVMWKNTPDRTAHASDDDDEGISLDVPSTPTLPSLTKQRARSMPIRRRPSNRQSKN